MKKMIIFSIAFVVAFSGAIMISSMGLEEKAMANLQDDDAQTIAGQIIMTNKEDQVVPQNEGVFSSSNKFELSENSINIEPFNRNGASREVEEVTKGINIETRYNKHMQKRVKHTLNGITNIIKKYAETEGIAESSKVLFDELSIFSDELNEEVATYPNLLNEMLNEELDESEEEDGSREDALLKLSANPLTVVNDYMKLLTKLYGDLGNQKVFMN